MAARKLHISVFLLALLLCVEARLQATELDAADVAGAQAAAGSGAVVAVPQYEVVEPVFVRALTSLESGRNDSNPVWAPGGQMIAFERSHGDKREIVIEKADGVPVQTIYFQLSGLEKDSKQSQFFLPGLAEDPSYNSGVSWARDARRVAFMSNGGEGNYDLYSQILGGEIQRLTDDKEKDGLADWSPTGNQIVFVSGRSGRGDVYLLEPDKHVVRQITRGDKPYLYPRWSPDGSKVAFIYGSTENHDIYVVDDLARPFESLRQLTKWSHDDLRPAWSPDGKLIAFYTNYNAAGEQRKWSLAVIHADGSDDGAHLEAQVVASDVIPDIEQGPAWLQDGSGLVYVMDDEMEYNPIQIVDIASKTIRRLKTDTKMNHDIACGPNGLIAFRAQHDQWDQIFVAKLKK